MATWAMVAVLAVATGWRLVHCTRPLVDKMCVKQAMAVLWARSIARPPFDPFRRQIDVWNPEAGRPLELIEEFPLYFTMLAGLFRLFGEHVWLGRAVSLVVMLAGSVAWYQFVRRRAGAETGLVALALLSFAPLVTFYSRAVMSDASMLGSMLVCVWAFDRYLDAAARARKLPNEKPGFSQKPGFSEPTPYLDAAARARKLPGAPRSARALGWLALTVAAGLAASAFKYYGAAVAIPLAAMVVERRGVLALLSPAPLAVFVLLLAPILVWVTQVFLPFDNPMRLGHEYFVFERPHLLASGEIVGGLLERVMWKGTGPVAALLALAGAGIVRRRPAAPWPANRLSVRDREAVAGGPAGSLAWPLAGWTAAGVGFYVLLAPKALTHDYYGLMLVPAASLWGAAGWRALRATRFPRDRTAWALPLLLVLAAAAGSPWTGARRLFAQEEGLSHFAAMLAAHTEPDACICVFQPEGGGGTLASLAQARRIGWVRYWLPTGPTSPQEPRRLAEDGADYVAFYFNRAHYDGPLLPAWTGSLTIVARDEGPWGKGGRTCTMVLARLRPATEVMSHE